MFLILGTSHSCWKIEVNEKYVSMMEFLSRYVLYSYINILFWLRHRRQYFEKWRKRFLFP